MTTPSRQAVIIGVDRYEDTSIANLKGAENDADEMYHHLRSFGDFTVDDDHKLVNERATSQNIRQAVSDLLWKTDECELALFYFSGHGLVDSYGNGFIAPHDIDRSCPLVCGIRMQELKDLMTAARNKKAVMMILDCCYSGIASDGDKAVSTSSAAAAEACLAPFTDPKLQDTGRFVLTSSGSDERSREKLEGQHVLGNQPPHPHGAFTFEILEGLDGRASPTGREITVGSLFDFISKSFENNKQHTPRLYGSGIGSLDIMLCRASRQAELENRVQEVKNLLSDESDLDRLFLAIANLKNILNDSPGLQEALEIRDLISHLLAPRQPSAVQRLTSTELLPLRSSCKEAFLRLQRAICRPVFDFSAVAQQDPQIQMLILSLFYLATEEIDLDIFKTQLVSYSTSISPVKLSLSQDVTRSMGSQG